MTPVALPELPKLPTTKLGGDGFAAIQMQVYAADYARLAVRMDRERCAAICDEMVLYTGYDCAAAIRNQP